MPDVSVPEESLPPRSVAPVQSWKHTDVQDLLESFTRTTGVTTALLDRDGNVLLTSPWQRICADFHRLHPDACARCVESDTLLASVLDRGEAYARHPCGNGLIDCACPLVLQGEHVANMFVGQFLTAAPDEAAFRSQAAEFGFDADAYIDALRDVPVIDEDAVRTVLALLNDSLTATVGVAAKLTRERKRSSEAENRLQLILDAVPQAIFWKDRSGAYMGGNRLLLENLGLQRPEQLIGKSEIELGLSPDLAEACAASDRAVMDTGMPLLHIEDRAQYPDGSVVWSDTCKIPLADESGEVRGLLGISEIVTERKTAEEELARLNAELEERVEERTAALGDVNRRFATLNQELTETNERLRQRNQELDEATRAKSDFLAAMSHDLRTPLNSILGFSGILLQDLAGPLSAEQRRQVGMINTSGQHLLELINHVLDLSRIEAGHVHVQPRWCDATELARSAADTIAPLAIQKGIGLNVSVDPECPAVRTDATRVEQVLFNLLGNAVKFTDSGRVALDIHGDDGEVLFVVSDTGCGIAEHDLERVFEDFYQIARPGGVPAEGTGLGLPVARRLAELLGGRIEVTSELGKGSTFTLRLPTRASLDGAEAPDGTEG
jgi:PAS domain S-box-containing protein